MNIGVIGVGAIGGTIAGKLVKAGHNVKVANSRGKEAVKEFASAIGAIPSVVYEKGKGRSREHEQYPDTCKYGNEESPGR